MQNSKLYDKSVKQLVSVVRVFQVHSAQTNMSSSHFHEAARPTQQLLQTLT